MLDEKTMEELVHKAVERVVSTQTAEEKTRYVEASRKELDRVANAAARARIWSGTATAWLGLDAASTSLASPDDEAGAPFRPRLQDVCC